MTLLQGALILGAGLIAGAMNAVAGGGTLITFPTLIWTGLTAINANATNTVALVPGALAGAWGYRRELREGNSQYYWLLIPSFIGGLIGGILLRYTPPATFAALVPWLILFAVVLFACQEPIQRWLRKGKPIVPVHETSQHWLLLASSTQFFTGIYGGYFGAGMGIMMLATLSVLGFSSIHQMNGLKNLLGMAINLIAALYFIFVDLVHWPEALVMAVGAIVGGYGGAGLARKLGPKFVRWAVIVIGVGMAISLLLK
ncbi:MAG: sulfite exporter TauE/SafE family protein [Acidobacteria bacterium]|nr:sulfite exporter TauE/SafE family protein [Acidobacteriota bacterium]